MREVYSDKHLLQKIKHQIKNQVKELEKEKKQNPNLLEGLK